MNQIIWIFSGVGVFGLTLVWQWYDSNRKKTTKKPEPPEMNMRILIIDNDRVLQNMLINAGWLLTRQKRDIVNFADEEVLNAQVIFVAVRGVGTTMFKDEGIGLAMALMERYPNKRVVLYSLGESVELPYNVARVVDAYVPQDSQPYEFVRLLEQFSRESSR